MNEYENNNNAEELEKWKKAAIKQEKFREALKLFLITFMIVFVVFGALKIARNTASNLIDSAATKPIIYLYPTEETPVSVKVGYPDMMTHIYPEYNDGWNVLAQPNGDLVDLNTGRYQYSLYYECKNKHPYEVTDTGFVVENETVIPFLEEKLAILGLSEREAAEFIIYWLPILESNEYNYIRFATYDEIESNMPLNIQPKPDSLIRVMMLVKGLDEPIEVTEQILDTPERTGFTVVEWGGVKILN